VRVEFPTQEDFGFNGVVCNQTKKETGDAIA